MRNRSALLLTTALVLLVPVGAAAAEPAPADPAVDPDLPVWGTVKSPNRGSQDNALLGVGVLSPTDAWAVGEWNPRDFQSVWRAPLAEHWDGTRWRKVRVPAPADFGVALLEDVSGVASDDVWAVGHGDDAGSGYSETLIEHWNGKRWRIVPSPNPSEDGSNQLFDVLAQDSDEVWAVGQQGVDADGLILRYDGSAWQVAEHGCGAGRLRGIAAVPGTSTAWAVGEGVTCFYDGTQWRRVSHPGTVDFEDVTAISPTDAWAVGFEVFCDPFTCYFSSAVQHWDGTRWSVVDHPLADSLAGVHAVAADDVWAVGDDQDGTVVQHWDGSDWTHVPAPDRGYGNLYAVDGAAADELWAVGRGFDDHQGLARQRTFVLQAPSQTQGQVIGDTNVSTATVTWTGPMTGSTTTDLFGAYDIPGLRAGRYTVIVSYPEGCQPATARVRVDVNETVIKDLELDC